MQGGERGLVPDPDGRGVRRAALRGDGGAGGADHDDLHRGVHNPYPAGGVEEGADGTHRSRCTRFCRPGRGLVRGPGSRYVDAALAQLGRATRGGHAGRAGVLA